MRSLAAVAVAVTPARQSQRERSAMTRNSLLVFAPLLAVVVIVAAGCGGGGAPSQSTAASTQTTAGLTNAEFVTALNAICVKALANAKAFTPTTMSQVAASGPGFMSTQQGYLAQMESLQPPADLASNFGRYESLLKNDVALINAVVVAAQSNDPAAFNKALGGQVQIQSDVTQENAAANSIGATGCVS